MKTLLKNCWNRIGKSDMNRLKNHSVYMVGSMDSDREAGAQWRDEMTPFLQSLGLRVINPYTKPLCPCSNDPKTLEDDTNFGKIQTSLKNKNYDLAKDLVKQLRATDLRFVDTSHLLLVYLDFDQLLTGTLEEIVTANRQKKPVIIKTSVPKNQMPHWYFGMLPHELFFETWNEVKEYLTHINSAPKIDDLDGRWVFFDQEFYA